MTGPGSVVQGGSRGVLTMMGHTQHANTLTAVASSPWPFLAAMDFLSFVNWRIGMDPATLVRRSSSNA